MVVTASYGLANSAAITTADVTGSCTVTPDPLTDGITQVTISYSENGVTQTTTCNITVAPKLTSLSATAPSTEYEYSDTFPSTYTATAHYSDGSTKSVTATCSNTSLNAVGNHTITLSYTDTGKTVTTSFTIDVKRKKVSKPALKSAYTSFVGPYTGSAYNINSATYLDNYSATYYTVTGNTQTNANGTGAAYSMVCTLNSNYRWSDGTTGTVTISWKIEQATRTISGLSDVSISSSALTKTLKATASAGAGTWSISPTSVTGLTTLSIDTSGNITITGNGSTAIAATTITVTISANGNYKAASATFKVSATYFNPNQYDNVGTITDKTPRDAAWWAELAKWAAAATAADRAKMVGKLFYVNLTTAVLGTTGHFVRCIGYDCDGVGTLTFETMNTLAEYTVFSASNALWVDGTTDSTARAKCKEYYNAFPGKNSIRSVQKRYCSVQNGKMTNTADKTFTETCFLVSICERGYAKANGYASSQEEFAVENTTKTPYQYFTGNDKRGKYKGTDTDPEGKTSGLTGYPWTRSRSYDGANSVCGVYNNGGADYNTCNGGFGLAPAFAIG